MAQYSLIGKRVPRVDGPAKATGRSLYTDDMVLPHMLYGKVLRSPLPHALILNIDASRAERLPGVKAFIAGRDTLGLKYGSARAWPETWDKHALAMDKVRHIGDEVAAVAAIDEDTAEEALELIKVDYEELSAVFDPEEAMQEGAPIIHEGFKNNVSSMQEVGYGDVEKGFAESDYIREDRFTSSSISHAYMEPRVALASLEPDGRLTVWTCTQAPYVVRGLLAMTLGMREGDIRLIKPPMGGGFGGKTEMSSHEFSACLLSIRTGRPVKIGWTRKEELSFGRRRHAIVLDVKTGVKRDGTLVARQCRNFLDGGAYIGQGRQVTFLSGTNPALPYNLPHYKYQGIRVYTNKPPASAVRGFGAPQVYFALESQLDMIAEDLGIDPIELRLKNASEPGRVVPGITKISSCGFKECLERVAEASGWKERRGKLPPNRGLGIGCFAYTSGATFNWFQIKQGLSNAEIVAHDNGTVTLLTMAADIGQGSDTVLTQICAEVLGLRMEDVKLVTADTELTPIDAGSWGSRVTFMAGHAVLRAAEDVKRDLFEAAAQRLNILVTDVLEAKDGHIYLTRKPERRISFADAVAAAQIAKGGRPVIGRGSYTPKGKGALLPAVSFGAQVAEVEVDRETGQVKVLKLTTAHDCGVALNPTAVEGQIDGGIHMALGQALSEQMVTDRGEPVNTTFLDYKIFSALDMPKAETIAVETYEPEGPFGAKEASEGLAIPTVPAIANAICNATGVRVKGLPITPEKLLWALREKEGA